ncbi:MAG: hypothetical protein WC554_18070, partial [Clostridia bacterium]
MPELKIGSKTFQASPELLQTMVDMMALTKADGNEHGFLMCDVDGVVQPGKKCVGNHCAIGLKDCGGKPVIGGFHTHPQVISFSLSDYISSFNEAENHPNNDYLLCVSLLDKGIRCKALLDIPSPSQIPWGQPDTEENREKVKPFFTKKVNISVQQIAELIAGTEWDKLSPAEEIVAIDEGDDTCAPSGTACIEPQLKAPK